MARYTTTTSDGNLKHTTPNKSLAIEAFIRAKAAGVARGVTLELRDTKTDQVLETFHRLSEKQIAVRSLEYALDYARSRQRVAGERIVAWAKLLTAAVLSEPSKDPGYLLQNADARCDDAAAFRAGAIIEVMLEKGSVEQVRDYMVTEALRGARHSQSSSSSSSNMVHRSMTAAYAAAADELDGIVCWAKEA